MTEELTACSIGCGHWLPDSEMYRLTRRPDESIETVKLRALGDPEPVAIIVSGPDHQRICPDCWHAAVGFLGELRRVRDRRRK